MQQSQQCVCKVGDSLGLHIYSITTSLLTNTFFEGQFFIFSLLNVKWNITKSIRCAIHFIDQIAAAICRDQNKAVSINLDNQNKRNAFKYFAGIIKIFNNLIGSLNSTLENIEIIQLSIEANRVQVCKETRIRLL